MEGKNRSCGFVVLFSFANTSPESSRQSGVVGVCGRVHARGVGKKEGNSVPG